MLLFAVCCLVLWFLLLVVVVVIAVVVVALAVNKRKVSMLMETIDLYVVYIYCRLKFFLELIGTFSAETPQIVLCNRSNYS